LKNFESIDKILNEQYIKHLPCFLGEPANYIPELAKADINDFAISIVTTEGNIYKTGNYDKKFTLQSISKPFVYGLALETHGREVVLSKVGVEPTGDAFNSIIELEKQSHRPYNPMINSGAIAISSLIKGENFSKRLEKIIELIENFVGHPVSIDELVFDSEKKTAHRNRAIANLLKHFSIIDGDIEESLDLYFKQCSILVDTVDLATIAATLANGGIQPLNGKKLFESNSNRDILSLMFSCGMYDTAGEWSFSVGLPAKSGVSGGILAVVPGKMGIAIYSPLIDQHGHSVRGVNVLKELSEKYNLSIFSSYNQNKGDK
jgi:glutaminase